jgi:hypothetical protein
MKMIWQNGEKGPTCTCGWPTTVMLLTEDGRQQARLLCIGHTKAEGASWALPSERKPDGWPDTVSGADMEALIQEGYYEEQKWQNEKQE